MQDFYPMAIFKKNPKKYKKTSMANGISSDKEIGEEEQIALRIQKRGIRNVRLPSARNTSSAQRKRIAIGSWWHLPTECRLPLPKNAVEIIF